MNTDSILCSSCGAVLDPTAPGGLCPRCLMAGAMIPTDPAPTARPTPPPTVEQVAAAFPQFEVLALIGVGGMGAVFRARQPKLNRLVALKVLPASLAERDPAFAERFEREGQMLAGLLTGELPVGNFAPPSERSAVDPRVDHIVGQALENERERRQQSAGEVRTQVETISGPPPPRRASSQASAEPSPAGAGHAAERLVARAGRWLSGWPKARKEDSPGQARHERRPGSGGKESSSPNGAKQFASYSHRISRSS